MQQHSTTPAAPAFTPGRRAPQLALDLRDALMARRSLAADFDAAGAVEATRWIYWLLLAGAALAPLAARLALAEQLAAAQAAELAAQVEQKRRASVERAARKAAYHLAAGLVILRARGGAYLVPSGTRGNLVHEVSADGQWCSCESAGHCWHLEAVAQHIAEQAAEQARPVFAVRNLAALLAA